MGLVIGNTEIRGVSIGTTGEQYVLPIAGENTLGGVKINGNNLAIDGNGVLSAGGGSEYTLPIASSTQLGGVKINGNNLAIAADGTLSAGGGGGGGSSGYRLYLGGSFPMTPGIATVEIDNIVIDFKDDGYPSNSKPYIAKAIDWGSYGCNNTVGCIPNVISAKITLTNPGYPPDEYPNAKFYLNGNETVFQNYDPITITLTSDSVLILNTFSCLHPSTLITLSDKKQVQLKDLKVGDKVLALDENGNEVEDIVDACDSQSTPKYGSKTDIWRFLDGTKIMTINPHEFYSVDEKKFKYIAEFNIGERILKQDGSTTQLISHETIEGKQQHMTLFTKRYNTYFANGILTGNRRSVKFNKEF